MILNRAVTAVLVFGSVLCTVEGCAGRDSNRAAVNGKVTVDGTPIAEGLISFLPIDIANGQPGGSPIQDGQYSISADKGLLPGEYQVQIRANRGTGKKVWDGMGDEHWPASKKNYVEKMESYIPARYNDRTTLKATIELGKTNTYDFDLQLPKK
jgi:hypothetical protein